MARNDRGRENASGAPAIILVRPQLGENIGTAARAMLNFGLADLRLVRPRDGWPNVKAVSAAAGATPVLDAVRLFDTTAEAVADLHHVLATTARPRDMLKPVVEPRRAAADMRRWWAAGEPSGVLFGRERTGLDNDDVALADAVVTVPINPAYASLNLAQAVLLIGYEWLQAASGDTPAETLPEGRTRPATHGEIENFFGHLERELDACGFLRNKPKRPGMVRNIRNLFLRAGLMEQEVQTLHGIVAELSKGRGAPADDADGKD
ncbi:MAG: RNA methyltransferase [Proteobacteria bacterium]|nr:RNA methyltransferase [Pseudomonadota bacterium]